jgi:hypothetical protein
MSFEVYAAVLHEHAVSLGCNAVAMDYRILLPTDGASCPRRTVVSAAVLVCMWRRFDSQVGACDILHEHRTINSPAVIVHYFAFCVLKLQKYINFNPKNVKGRALDISGRAVIRWALKK